MREGLTPNDPSGTFMVRNVMIDGAVHGPDVAWHKEVQLTPTRAWHTVMGKRYCSLGVRSGGGELDPVQVHVNPQLIPWPRRHRPPLRHDVSSLKSRSSRRNMSGQNSRSCQCLEPLDSSVITSPVITPPY